MQQENKYLQLQGFVSPDVLNTSGFDEPMDANISWFFVDYSPKEYPVGAAFDVVLSGKERTMVPQIFHIRLLKVCDQFGNTLNSIPGGTKTICKFAFSPSLPQAFEQLPVLAAWKFNPESLLIAHHSEIQVDEVNTIPDEMVNKIVDSVISVVSNRTSSAGIDARKILAEPDKLKAVVMDKLKEPD